MTEQIEQGGDIRSDIAAAMDKVESAAPEPTPIVQEASGDAPAADVALPVVEEAKSDRARNELGQFAKKDSPPTDMKPPPVEAKVEALKPEAVKEPPKVEEKVEEVVPFEGAKPIQALRPATREHWSKLPPEAQKDMVRWEKETQRVIRETADIREQNKRWSQTIAPYEAMLRGQNLDPHQFTGSLYQTVAALATAPQPVKAQVLAQIVQTYGVDIQALDQALSGQIGQQPQQNYQQPQYQQPQQFRDPRLDQLLAMQQQRIEHEAETSISQIEGKEFFADVKLTMADILDNAAKRGVSIPLEEVYNRACWATPDVAEVLSQRQAARQAASPDGPTQRARMAASSVKPSPAAAPGSPVADDTRSAVEAAFNRLIR